MQYNNIKNADKLASAIERLLDSNEEAKLYKKLHTVLLVARHPDNNSSEVARQLEPAYCSQVGTHGVQ